MLVDDAHWADGPSLRALAYLAARIADLPVAIVVTTRTGEPATDAQALMALRVAADTSVLKLGSLSAQAVDAIVNAAFPEADESFRAACRDVTDGNPFLVVELLEQVRSDGRPADRTTAARLDGLAPDAVLDAVVARLGAQPPAVGAVARAVAVLGDGAPLRLVAGLTELPMADLVRAADSLNHMHLLCPGEPFSFIHPLIRSSVEQSMSPLDRGLAHLRAARILDEGGAPAEAIAPHLLVAPAEGDQRTAAILRDAARTALSSGAAESAVRMLRRALLEGVAGEQTDLLAELGEAEAAAGLGDSVRRLKAAIGASSDPLRRAELALTQATVLHRTGQPREAAEVLKRSLDELADDDSPLARDLAAMYVSAASQVPELAGDTQEAGDRLLSRLAGELRPTQRGALAHLALHQARTRTVP